MWFFKKETFFLFILFFQFSKAQLPVGKDTLTVIENGKCLKLAWAGGLNSCMFSQLDLNHDGKKDLIAFDKVNNFAYGIFRCFLNEGSSGEIKYRYTDQYNSSFPSTQQWAYFYDYNNDGKSDLFTYALGGIKVFQNTSTASVLSFSLCKNYLTSNTTPSTTPSYANIYASAISLPGFSDIDNDGDMDILTFSAGGFQLEYHKNLSMELFSSADSLRFELNESSWGDFSESNCSVLLNQFKQAGQENLHSGSCLLCFDRDGDGDKDLLMGDVACNTAEYLENGGTTVNAHITDTTKLYPNYPNKASTQIIKFNSFPCSYHLDIDNDSKKDLIASPNAINSENSASVWFYKNASTTSTVDFQFVKNNFLQDEMMEHGEGAYPVLVDVDADGLLDLIVGNMGYYQNGTNKTKLAFYKNTGTLAQASYSLITRDYAGLSAFATTNNLIGLVPTFGDIDGDGDKDMIVTDYYGKIHWIENTAGAGNAFNFTVYKYNHFGITTTNGAPYPQLIDVNRDNLLDLIIGLRNGRLAYYKNIGSASVPSFSLITNTFGNVNVKGSPSLYSTDGSCAPFMYDDAGTYKLLCGSISGRIFSYDNIDGNLNGNFNLLDTNVNKIYDGPQSTLQYVDINNDNKRDLILGNYAGGLSFYNSKTPIGLKENTFLKDDLLIVYPNPTHQLFTIKINSTEFINCTSLLYDALGKVVLQSNSESMVFSIPCQNIAPGVYILSLTLNHHKGTQQTITKKIIIH